MKKTTLKQEADALKETVIQVGEIVIIKKSLVKEEFQHDLRFQCKGGFGVDPRLRGTALIGTWLADGEQCRLERYDIDWMATARYRREQAKVNAIPDKYAIYENTYDYERYFVEDFEKDDDGVISVYLQHVTDWETNIMRTLEELADEFRATGMVFKNQKREDAL